MFYFTCWTHRLPFSVSSGVFYAHVQGQTGDEDVAVDVKLYSHRWRRWLPPKPRNMDSNRASQEQDQEPEQVEPEGFPGLLSAEDTDNSSQIEVGAGSHKFTLTEIIAVVIFYHQNNISHLRGRRGRVNLLMNSDFFLYDVSLALGELSVSESYSKFLSRSIQYWRISRRSYDFKMLFYSFSGECVNIFDCTWSTCCIHVRKSVSV